MALFVLRVPAKFTLGALLKPLFRQFQKWNSRKFKVASDSSGAAASTRQGHRTQRREAIMVVS